MSGIYIHIPFCKQACHYCNFHFSTSLQYKNEMLEALLHEITLQAEYLSDKELSSIYFGGGTPSLLSAVELGRVFDHISRYFIIKKEAEITLEANPDDLTEEKLQQLKATPVNRLSIGVQSFFDADLQFMNRAHTGKEAKAAVENALEYGFNLSVDLIYGTPTMSKRQWEENLNIVFNLNIPHISAYCLTIEPKTALAALIAKGKAPDIDEEHATLQFRMLMQAMQEKGYLHYEISNFARPGHLALHNTNYWKGAHYLGIGPSAHSFNGSSRQWNVSNNAAYIRSIKAGEIPAEKEILSSEQQYNEYVLTSLRTMWGTKLKSEIRNQKSEILEYYLSRALLQQEGDHIFLTNEGKLFADQIAADLFI